jgi:AbrB family looped-hinge helix DNA binding protein
MNSAPSKRRLPPFEPKPISTVSGKYQIVIPKHIRQRLRIKPGDQLCFLDINGALRLVPVRPVSEMRGTLKGAKVDFSKIRQKKDREL